MKTVLPIPDCRSVALVFIAVVTAVRAGVAQTPLDEESPWPRVRSTNGNTVTLHLPQVERWTSSSFAARAAVQVKPAGAKEELVGVVWFEAHGSVDRAKRVVTLDRLDITRARFPEATDSSSALAIVREVFPSDARTVSLDYLVTALGFQQAAARQGAGGLKHTPPEIIWATNHTVLVLIDGEPILRPIPSSTLGRVINTPALLVHDKANDRFYLSGEAQWFAASSIKGPWSWVQNPPADLATLVSPPQTNPPAGSYENTPLPRVIVRTGPAELLVTGGMPDFRPIRGTALQYAADSDSLLFFHTTEREAYLLLSGRWFKAKSLQGPWMHVAPRDLPPDFAKIPPGSPQAVALASVPGTPQADLALLANSMPTTATVSRKTAKIELNYDGEPKFKSIEDTAMSYAVNAQLPVIRLGEQCYAVDDGVWFVGASPTGPWEVAMVVPEEIYTIPPSSPVYYATFSRVYEADEKEVEVGYTPGYQGAYEDDGTVVYGTGWDYEPWYGDEYYGWGWTWGYNYWYVPWYGWWVWRPWWNPPGGLRAALIENIYDRWQSRPGVIHHDGAAAAMAGEARRIRGSGFPAMYGRFKGSPRPTAMTPPPNTLALNPYSRPTSAVRGGETPRGAQLLSNVRQAPGGGRDLYASPDGGVYRRQVDGWYRRQAGGGWSFFAPAQGEIDRSRVNAARGMSPSGVGAIYRPTAGRGAAPVAARPLVNRGPNTGFEVRAQEVAALERQYYARSLSQVRAQNWRGSSNISRPARGGVRRR